MTYVSKSRYQAKYVVLSPNKIFNYIGPERLYHNTPDNAKAVEKHIKNRNELDGFYDSLEANIQKQGIRNPIVVNAGWLPVSIWDDTKYFPDFVRKEGIEKALVCLQLGGSRLWYANKYNLEIPCIVNDFVNMFPNDKVLYSRQDIADCFTDLPKGIWITRDGIEFDPCYKEDE